MKQLFRFVRDHWLADFRPDVYGLVSLLLALSISFNYYINLEDGLIDAYRGSPVRMLLYFLLYAFGWYGTVAIWTLLNGQRAVWQRRDFWVYSLFGIGIYSVYAGFYGYQQLSLSMFDGQAYTFVYSCLSNLQSILTVVLPMMVFYFFYESRRNGFYGLAPKRKALRLYASLLLLMVPLIGIAALQPSFLETYPVYRDTGANEYFGVPEWVTALVFELAYGWDFIPTELLFRGFLVIGLSPILGRGTVLPMVVMYAFIHFGKPPGETISSIFGGYILGVLALYTRSIWGGVMVHLGVAWLMEAAAFLRMLTE